MAQPKKSPATGFLVMAIFNLVAAVVLIVFYFPYKNAGGAESHYLLIAGGVCAVSSVVLYLLYGVFKQKLDNLR